MRQLGARIPPPEGCRWSQEAADSLIGQSATLEVGLIPGGPGLTGTVVEAKVLDDEMGHALWVTVEAPWPE